LSQSSDCAQAGSSGLDGWEQQLVPFFGPSVQRPWRLDPWQVWSWEVEDPEEAGEPEEPRPPELPEEPCAPEDSPEEPELVEEPPLSEPPQATTSEAATRNVKKRAEGFMTRFPWCFVEGRRGACPWLAAKTDDRRTCRKTIRV
jgi:hypothetical protein